MQEVKTISPQEAWEIMQNEPRTVMIDVRSDMEFLFVGHPVGAIHIPWIDYPDWRLNPDFVTEVRKLVLGGVCYEKPNSGVPILLICRSGKRSLEAGNLLPGDDVPPGPPGPSLELLLTDRLHHQRLEFDGFGMRYQSFTDGCRCAHQRAGCGCGHGPDQGRG